MSPRTFSRQMITLCICIGAMHFSQNIWLKCRTCHCLSHPICANNIPSLSHETRVHIFISRLGGHRRFPLRGFSTTPNILCMPSPSTAITSYLFRIYVVSVSPVPPGVVCKTRPSCCKDVMVLSSLLLFIWSMLYNLGDSPFSLCASSLSKSIFCIFRCRSTPAWLLSC
jgi:hypothetical protein